MSATYFIIEESQINLEENQIYPFHLSVYSYHSGVYRLYLSANSPLSAEKLAFLQEIMKKGAALAVNRNQKKTFLGHQGLTEDDIASLKSSPLATLANRSFDLHIKLQEKDEREGPFRYKEQLNQSIDKNDFMPLIQRVRDEGMTLSYRVSHTVSLANHFCEHLLTEDNMTNRVVALSYLLCKTAGITDEQSLGDIICAAFLVHIGITQLKLDLARNPHQDFSPKDMNLYKKHPGLTQHLIRKAGLKVSERCNKVMYQHHERFDGSGYPEYKRGEHTEPMALILGVSTHIIEHTRGIITGKKMTVKSIVQSFQSYNPSAGLEMNFGDQVHDLIANLLREKQTSSEPEKEEQNQAA